jgi:DNA-directed RNA polymerase subunit RPC12/RpoP
VAYLTKTYLVLQCEKCSRYLLAVSNNKTRACPYCGKRVVVEKAKILASSNDAKEARVNLQKLKLREESNKPSLATALR